MNYSDVSICNIALGLLGEETITELNSNTVRSRVCRAQFAIARDRLLELADWHFARRSAPLRELVITDPLITLPSGYTLYALPSDCLVPRDIWPRGTQYNWEMMYGGVLLSDSFIEPRLVYTGQEVNPQKFSAGFVHLLSLDLAARLCRPITGDAKLGMAYSQQYTNEKEDIIGRDANIGSYYRPADNRAETETFINPDFDASTSQA